MYQSEIDLMIRAAEKAAESLLADFQQLRELTIEHKGKGDLVSQADKKSEELIFNMLRDERPDWGFLGEEGTDIIGNDPSYRWIIDPLDGTRNFLHNLPHWCVTIALEKDNEIVAGVTYSPLTNEKFHAIKNGGAFKNGQPIKAGTCTQLDDALVLVDLGHRCCGERKTNMLTDLANASGTIRILGCGALSLCYIAAGYYDAMVHVGAAPWDLAAGYLFMRETRCSTSDFSGQPAPYMDNQGLIAANPALESALVKVLSKY